jgi:hypothetical protein
MNVAKLRRSLRIRIKALFQSLICRHDEQNVLYIVGCQRSGTTMLSRIFERDWYAKSYGEVSELSSKDREHRIRLNALDEVAAMVRTNRAPLVVLKPIVESHRTPELLSGIEGSKALWVYRDYRDVAASNVRRFKEGTADRDLRAIVSMDKCNWRSEYVPDDVRETVCRLHAEGLSAHDAAVLFWYVRNRLYFDLGLDSHPSVMLCKYEALASSPDQVMRTIYSELGRKYPGPHITRDTHARSIRKGSRISLNREVEDIADSMLDRLDREWQHSVLTVPSYHIRCPATQ